MQLNERKSLIHLRRLTLAASIALFALIVLGGVVRTSGSSGACLDWPACLGAWTPPPTQSALIDYTHRFLTLLLVPLVLGSALLGWRRFRSQRWISWPVYTAAGLLAAQIALGGLVAVGGLPIQSSWLSALHLGLSLLMMAALLAPTVISFYGSSDRNTWGNLRLRFLSPYAHLSLLTLGMVLLLFVSGALVAGSGSSVTCSSWPLCEGGLAPSNLQGWLNLAHRFFVVLAAFLLVALLVRAWRTQRTQTPVLVAATAAFVLFFAQALLGAKMIAGLPPYLLAVHQATSVAVWAALVVEVLAVGITARTGAEDRLETRTLTDRKGLAKDLLLLTKPIVVVLLLVTTFAGMVIGTQTWPPLSLTLWTLLGGFMAAGGSGAINQFIDRHDDGRMQRTQKRPIPSGRLTPAEGLAFGVALCLTSFFVMLAFVNLLAALLSLAGIIYYVLLYSIFLKKATVQNIVIGGGAGAIPPLVGWAAATGGLNIPSLFLFAVVFMWTPPHFWALALVRRKDYARAGVPMLPVIRGEKETRWQIFLYTCELIVLTLLLPLFGLGGAIYLIGALILGGWLLMAAWKVWKQGGNKLAWKMYRYSSMYLAFLFMILMIDRLV